ncbi:recf/recn/smc domain containing protein [Gigaspora margarita]|uniref:Recf/recn/smc domain containing protein n=1 Tax=Gigaspora margarita TaxID=4874 RepID=A0A8H4A0S9_GIGMA|nr:recf/recn/smc domain containing protein [Gigaspora margarita]
MDYATIQKFQEGSNETSSRQGTMYSSFSHSGGTIETQAMDRNSSMDIQSMIIAVKKEGVKQKRKDLWARCLNAFHSKKDPQQSIAILSKHWGKSCGEYLFLHKMNSAESLPKQLEYDSCLVINRLGEFYLCIPEPLEIRAENQGPLFSENQKKV